MIHSSNLHSKWITHIRSIINNIGRPDLWLLQNSIQSKSLAYFTKRNLTEQFIQEWYAKRSQSIKALTYFSYKQNLELESYFLTLPRKLYLYLFKLRTANHKLPVETGRWDGTARNERVCTLCNTLDIGDEFHYICKCPFFDTERVNFIKPYFRNRPSMFKFGQLVATRNVPTQRKLCQFAEIIFHKFS